METMVAVAIFTVVFTIGVGGFISAMRTQRQLQALISANSNASLVIEQMAREIRTGLVFHTYNEDSSSCDSSSAPCPRLGFINGKGEDVAYTLDSTNLQILRYSPSAMSGAPITAGNVAVRYLGFKALGDTCDTEPDHNPRITIVLGISPRNERGVNEHITEIQTTVSSRQGFLCAYPTIEVL